MRFGSYLIIILKLFVICLLSNEFKIDGKKRNKKQYFAMSTLFYKENDLGNIVINQ